MENILSRKEIEFLKELGHELKTQNRMATAKPVFYQIIDDDGKQGAFLTMKSAEKHLEENRHHYREEAHIYVSHAFRNPELEKLLDIIEKFDNEDIISNENTFVKFIKTDESITVDFTRDDFRIIDVLMGIAAAIKIVKKQSKKTTNEIFKVIEEIIELSEKEMQK